MLFPPSLAIFADMSSHAVDFSSSVREGFAQLRRLQTRPDAPDFIIGASKKKKKKKKKPETNKKTRSEADFQPLSVSFWCSCE